MYRRTDLGLFFRRSVATDPGQSVAGVTRVIDRVSLTGQCEIILRQGVALGRAQLSATSPLIQTRCRGSALYALPPTPFPLARFAIHAD